MEKENILTERIELMFFDSKKNHNEYFEFQNIIRPKVKIPVYSPLYNLRNEIFELRKNGYWLSAILLCHTAIDGIVKYFFNKQSDKFYLSYMELTAEDYLAQRVYRNTRVHNFGQLVGHLNKKWKKIIYNKIILPRNNIDKNIYAKIKVAFTLCNSFSNISRIVDLNLIEGKNGPYYKIEFYLNPNSFIEAFEKGCEKLKENVLTNEKLQKVIMEDLTEDNWMKVS